MTIERSQQLGRVVMAVSGVSLAIFLAGIVRRSYLVLAIPVAIMAGAAAGLTFWIGYTMATTRWETDDLDEAEGPLDETPAAAPPLAGRAPATAAADSDYGLRP